MKIETKDDLEKLEKIISILTKNVRYDLSFSEWVSFTRALPILQSAIDNFRNPPKLPVISTEELAKKVTPIGRVGKKK